MNILKRIENLKPLPMDNHISSFVSTDTNDRINIRYYFDKENGHLFARVVFGEKAQGPPGHAHGGAIASALDESMGAAAWMNGFTAMTAKLEVNFYRALKLDNEAFVETWVEHNSEKKVWIKGKMTGNDNTVYAESNGLFILQTKERFQSMGEIPEDMFTKLK